MIRQQAAELLSADAPKKTRVTRSSLISNTRWLRTADGITIYSFMPRTLPNRAAKDELANALKKRNVDVTIFSRELNMKSTGEKVHSYVIAVDSAQFSNTFPGITAKPTSINFTAPSNKKETA